MKIKKISVKKLKAKEEGKKKQKTIIEGKNIQKLRKRIAENSGWRYNEKNKKGETQELELKDFFFKFKMASDY